MYKNASIYKGGSVYKLGEGAATPDNFEVPKQLAIRGDAVYKDSFGNARFIRASTLDKDTIPEGWAFIGVVSLRDSSTIAVLHNTENSSVKWASMWLFKVNGLKLDGTDTFVLQQGPESGSTPVEIGTFTATAAATDLDTLVSELDTWLRANTTAEGALADYNWHAEKHADADGVDSCFIVVDNISNQSRFSPIKSSTSGASAPLYIWDWCRFVNDSGSIKRKDGVSTWAVVWNKDRFKAVDSTVNDPTDSLTSYGIYNEAGFNATTIVKDYYGTYDNYLDNMVPDDEATTGAYASFNGKGQDVFDALKDVSFPNISGTDTKVFAAEAWAATLGQLDGEDFIIPSINTYYKIFSAMKTDGSDGVNSTFVKAGSAARPLAASRWVPARTTSGNAWILYSGGYFSGSYMGSNPRVAAVAEIDLE